MLPVIFLMGPTASGKTDLAIDLVQNLNCEIISVDSAMIYRGMDIGTAKPDRQELLLAPHHLIDIIEPTQTWSAADFCFQAQQLIKQIHNNQKIPLLTGGTMMYFKAFLEGISGNLPNASPELRNRLQRQLDQEGIDNLANDLIQQDPRVINRIDLKNPQRVIRALEVYLTTGKSITAYWDEQQAPLHPWPIIQLAVNTADRKTLHSRIEQRFGKMLNAGFEQEVIRLRTLAGIHADLPSIRSVGYRQMWQYLDGLFPYEEMQEKGIIATRQLAKRQLTWLRSWKDVEWFDSQNSNLHTNVRNFINKQIIHS